MLAVHRHDEQCFAGHFAGHGAAQMYAVFAQLAFNERVPVFQIQVLQVQQPHADQQIVQGFLGFLTWHFWQLARVMRCLQFASLAVVFRFVKRLTIRCPASGKFGLRPPHKKIALLSLHQVNAGFL